jgi:hypothetical protein
MKRPIPSAADDPCVAEAHRFAALLADLASKRRRSVRSLEREMGMGASTFLRVLKGDTSMQVRHLLMIVKALEMSWPDFFREAYPELAQPPAPAAPPGQAAVKRQMVELLVELGFFDKPDRT